MTAVDDAPRGLAPHNLLAEQAVLGGMLLSKAVLAEVAEALTADDFYQPAHQMVFSACLDLFARGQQVDPITIAAALTQAGEIGRVGGAPYLHTLMQAPPVATPDAILGYARLLTTTATRRRLLMAGQRITQLAESSPDDVDDLVDQAQQAVYEIAGKRRGEDVTVLEHLLPPALDEMEAIGSRGTALTGVPTGYRDLDELTQGLHPGQMIVIAGRPGSGKSTAGLDIARFAAIAHSMTTVVFSLEMSKLEITMRLLSAEAKVGLKNIRSGLMTDHDWQKIAHRQLEIAGAPLYVDDSPNLTMTDIRAKARRLKEQNDLRLIVVDYLQLMSGSSKRENRQQEVSELSRNFKLLAKELEVPVIAMSQLNRGPETRSDKKPMVSDLRESGAIEQDSDLVILLHREDMYEVESARAGEADFIVAKHRNGPQATVTVLSQLHYSRFVDKPFG